MAGRDWTDDENDRTVADYFAMLGAELAGRSYNKAEHNRRLRDVIGRERGAIEFKHQNISAVLLGLGEAWIPGYKPAFNFQASLVDAVARWTARNPDWFDRTPRWRSSHESTSTTTQVGENAHLWIGPPPTSSAAIPLEKSEEFARIVSRFDPARRDERNRMLGRAGEELVLTRERSFLVDVGRPDLARKVRWVSVEDGDGAGYDIASFDLDGRPRLLEVKTTNGWERTPFFITPNELRVADELREDWRLLRLWDFSRTPRAFELRPPLASHVSLVPSAYRAELR